MAWAALHLTMQPQAKTTRLERVQPADSKMASSLSDTSEWHRRVAAADCSQDLRPRCVAEATPPPAPSLSSSGTLRGAKQASEPTNTRKATHLTRDAGPLHPSLSLWTQDYPVPLSPGGLPERHPAGGRRTRAASSSSRTVPPLSIGLNPPSASQTSTWDDATCGCSRDAPAA